MPSLAEFQQQFAAALLTPTLNMGAAMQAGLSVHRNTVMKGLIDVLSANYPTVERLVGAEWFRAAADIYARDHLPRQPALALYGEQFANFLHDFPPAAQLPYLSDVARLDRLWTEAHFSADTIALRPEQLAILTPEKLQHLQLRLHPSTRFAWCAHSAVTIWRFNRPAAEAPPEIEIEDAEEGALFARPVGAIEVLSLNRSEYFFLSQLQTGLDLGSAAIKVLEQNVGADIAAILARFIGAGVFTTIQENS